MSESILGTGVTWADALEALATSGAVLAGFWYSIFDRHNESEAAGLAASRVSKRAVDYLSSRLEVLVGLSANRNLALRGAKTSEMIQILREIDLSKVKHDKLEILAVIRSTVFAVNFRIDEVLTELEKVKDEEKRRLERKVRLKSAALQLGYVREELIKLAKLYKAEFQESILPDCIDEAFKKFISES
jgi:hypothetical protein